MKVPLGMAVVAVVLFSALGITKDSESPLKRYFIDAKGGGFEVHVQNPADIKGRDAIRHQLQRDAQSQSSWSSPAMRKHQRDIAYRYEDTESGGRIRITSTKRNALAAIHTFLRSHMDDDKVSEGVRFSYIPNTFLITVPVMVNGYGPYRFLLDTGANSTILSAGTADQLRIEGGKPLILFSAAGDVVARVQTIDTLQVGEARLRDIEIAIAGFGMLEELHVDGILGADYLRRFKIRIDYEKQIVQIHSESVSMSLLVA